jgi:hypothetical protein
MRNRVSPEITEGCCERQMMRINCADADLLIPGTGNQDLDVSRGRVFVAYDGPISIVRKRMRGQ